MANTNINLTLNSTANTSGIKSVTDSLKQQQQQLKALQSAETARAAAARASIAQQRALQASVEANAKKTVASQMAASNAFESARAATARADIAHKAHAVTLQSLGSRANESGNAMRLLGGAAVTAGQVANGAFTTLVSTIGTVASVAGKAALALAAIGTAGLAAGIKSAADLETQTVLSKGNIASVLGGDRQAADQFIKAQNAAIVQGAGGILDPAVSRKFATIFADDIVKAFGSTADSANLSARMSNQLSGLVTLGGADQGEFTNVISDIINGSTSENMLRQRDVLGQSGLLKPLMDELEKTGKSIKEMSPSERITALDKALQRALTSDTLQELADTATGQMQILKNRLIGENGLFSVLRDTMPNVAGNQNVFEQFKNSLGLLFNPDGLFAQIGRILTASGINLDVMRGIRDGWERFNRFLQSVNTFLLGIGNVDELAARLGGANGIADRIAELINGGIDAIPAGTIGKAIADGLNFLGRIVTQIDLGLVATKVGEGIVALVANLEWQGAAVAAMYLAGPTIARIVANGVKGMVVKAMARAAATETAASVGGSALGAGATGAGTTGLLAKGAKLGPAILAIGGLIAIFTAPDWNAVGAQLRSDAAKAKVTLQQMGQNVSDTLTGTGQNITTGMNNVRTSMAAGMLNIQNSFVTTVQSIATNVQSGWTLISTSVSTAVASMLATASALWNELVASASAAWSAMVATISGTINNIISAATSAWNSLVAKAQEIGSAVSGLSDVGSIISDAWNSLVAKANEFKNWILSLVPGTGGGSGEGVSFTPVSARSSYSGGVAVGSLNIYQSSNQSPEQLADQVLAAIDEKLYRRRMATTA